MDYIPYCQSKRKHPSCPSFFAEDVYDTRSYLFHRTWRMDKLLGEWRFMALTERIIPGLVLPISEWLAGSRLSGENQRAVHQDAGPVRRIANPLGKPFAVGKISS